MMAAIPLFGSRVSPRCLFSKEIVVVKVEDGKLVSRITHPISDPSEDALLDELVELGVDTLVCGGVDQDFVEDAHICRINVINNVAGEVEVVIQALKEGRLVPGFGLSREREAAASPSPDVPAVEVHCLRCADKLCMEGKPCSLAPLAAAPFMEPVKRQMAEVADDISSEEGPKMCRVAELVHFALGMGYKRIGVAFCVEMFAEAEILCGVLQRFFEVVPVCCRIGAAPVEEEASDRGSCCNVIGQAEILNRHNTDLNVMAGLCVGCDILFAGHSAAPATTLFVKDKSLANNPVGALYSRYHLDSIIGKSGLVALKGGPR
jgi:uncharacterized metal-binding protein/predicted Fe-Mo cluster-binding NifX family protein